MSAYFENGVFGSGERAWHGQGVVIPDDVFTVERAIELVPELGTVEMQPAYYRNPLTGEFEPVTLGGTDEEDALQRYVAVRQHDGKVLGDGLSHLYQPRQTVEKFDFMDALLGGKRGKRRAMLHTAGTLQGGSVAWLLARLDGDLKIGDDHVARFLFCSDTFDGSSSTRVAFTNVRIVCSNTLAMAINGAQRTFKARHVGDLSEKLEQAADILGLAEAYNEAYYEQATAMLKTRMTGKQVQAFLDRLIPIPVAADPTRIDRAARNAADRQSAITAILEHDDLANIKGTAWGVYNAVAEYADWLQPSRGSAFDTADANRFRRALDDGGIKDRALSLLVSA